MNKNHVGKLSPDKMNALVENRLGAPNSQIVLGPGPGLDFGVVDCGNGMFMAIAEDPIFPAAGLPLEMMGEFTVHIGASDIAVSGIKPQFMTYSLLLPPGTSEEDTGKLIQKISDTAKELNISIVGGHTGWYSAVTLPIIGGVTVWGYSDKWVSPGGAKAGDYLLMTKGPGIEAAALLGVLYSQKENTIPESIKEKLLERVHQITVVKDAEAAYKTGWVHAMHDATEGGVYGGLWEMKASAEIGLEVNLSDSMIPEDIKYLADYLDFDPWSVISEGTLLCAAKDADAVMKAWQEQGIESVVIGRFTESESSLTVNGEKREFAEPAQDPFWKLFDNALK